MNTSRSSASTPLALPPLPYPDNGLAPYISKNTLSFHHGKHHRAYVDNLNKLLAGTERGDGPLEKVVRDAAGSAADTAVFNNAAQAWNHAFYWKSLRPRGGGVPPAALRDKMQSSFGDVETCRREFAAAALAQFGSGWAWLVENSGRLNILKTSNADTPLTLGVRPLLTIDVWEHAYYLDHQNRRADYVTAVLDHLINWEFALENL